MQRQKSFGRRGGLQSGLQRTVAPSRPSVAPLDIKPPAASVVPAPDIRHAAQIAEAPSVDAEVEEWNRMRKARRRSFREPWRSVSIVAGIGFALSSWLLPDSVSDIMQLVTAGLTVASIAAGFGAFSRKSPRPQ